MPTLVFFFRKFCRALRREIVCAAVASKSGLMMPTVAERAVHFCRIAEKYLIKLRVAGVGTLQLGHFSSKVSRLSKSATRCYEKPSAFIGWGLEG